MKAIKSKKVYINKNLKLRLEETFISTNEARDDVFQEILVIKKDGILVKDQNNYVIIGCCGKRTIIGLTNELGQNLSLTKAQEEILGLWK